MSNGEPLVVRGALKPISTLTKPLRSRRHRDQGARPGPARAHRLHRRPGRRRRRRGDGRAGARARLPREVRRRPHRRRPRRARRLQGAHRVAALSGDPRPNARLHRLHGRGQVEAAQAAAPAALDAVDADALEREARRCRSPSSSSARARPSSAAARRSSSSALLERGTARRRARRRQRAARARVREALARPRRRLARRRARGAWERAEGSERPLARDRDAFDALLAERAPIYAELADAVVPGAQRGRRAGAPEPARRCDRCTGGRGWCGREAPRASTRRSSARASSTSGDVAVRPGGASVVTDATVGGLYAGAVGHLPARSTVAPGEQAKTLGEAERVLRELAELGMTRRPRSGRPRRRRRRRPRGLLRRRPTSAASRSSRCRRPGRPGRLGLRRQDRGGPAGGEELRRRLPPAGGGARRHRRR